MQGLTDGEKQSELKPLSVSLVTSFIGALPAEGAEEEEDNDSPWDSEVLSVEDSGVPTRRGAWRGGVRSRSP